MQADGGGVGGGRMKVRCYSVCGKPSYNARTCQEVAEVSDLAASDIIIVGSQGCQIAIKDSYKRVVGSIRLADIRDSLIRYVIVVGYLIGNLVV